MIQVVKGGGGLAAKKKDGGGGGPAPPLTPKKTKIAFACSPTHTPSVLLFFPLSCSAFGMFIAWFGFQGLGFRGHAFEDASLLPTHALRLAQIHT